MPDIKRLLLRSAEQIELDSRRALLSLLEYAPGAKLVDLGSGDGEFTLRAARKIGTSAVFGVDIAEDYIRLAQRKGVEVLSADLNHGLPFEMGSVDVVCASHSIEHLHDTDMFLKEIARILKPGGYAVIATPNLAAWHHVLFLLFGKQPTIAEVSDLTLVGTWSPRGRNIARIGPAHRRIFTLTALEGLIEYHGLRVEKAVGSGFFPLSGPFAGILSSLDKRHATNLVVKARKVLT